MPKKLNLDLGVTSKTYFESSNSEGVMVSMYKSVPGTFYWSTGQVIDLDEPIRKGGPSGRAAVEAAGFDLPELLLARQLQEAQARSEGGLAVALAKRREAIGNATSAGDVEKVEALMQEPLEIAPSAEDEDPSSGAETDAGRRGGKHGRKA